MQRRGLVFLLISGCFLVVRLQSDGLIRVFHAIEEKKSWTDAQTYCRDKYTDLATIQNPDQNHQAHQLALTGDGFWIGLFNQSWRWSGENRVFRTRNTFVDWDGTRDRCCATLSKDRKWRTKDCREQKALLCYSAEYQKHFLVKQNMSWWQAKKYCRTNYTDLSSIKSNEENINAARLLEEGSDDKAWIGLHRHFWTWSDGSSAAYRHFAEQQSHNNKEDCVMMDSNQWHSEECQEELRFICYKDESVLFTDQKHTALKTVKVRLRVGSADLSDPELQDAILRQLQQKLEDAGVTQEVKLSWRRSSDGNIFTREEEDEL